MGTRVKPESLRDMKQRGEPIVMMTCYDYPMAQLQDAVGVDVVFVGDSVGVNVLGYDHPMQVTMADMVHHTRAVRRGVHCGLLLADLPFGSYATPEQTLENAQLLMDAGAEVVKLEGGRHILPQIEALVADGIFVIGHLGYTPQTRTGERPVFGDRLHEAIEVLEDALLLEQAGALGVVLECVPERVAQVVTERLGMPTIGIGAGRWCDGQVLVLPDLLGIQEREFRFVKQYARLRQPVKEAFSAYRDDVKARRFPEDQHRFLIKRDVLRQFKDWALQIEGAEHG